MKSFMKYLIMFKKVIDKIRQNILYRGLDKI